MPNSKYQRGVRLERYFVNLGKQHGWMASRSAGSHGPWDVVWFRESGLGTINEALEQIRGEGWFPQQDLSVVPDPFLYGFFRYTRGLNKQYIWCLPVGDGYGQVLLIQVKTKQGKRKVKA